ncbi:hypothetical protein VTN31DRAFT_7376 [Thermomyces dupontii]|uniref:uncharacterized protein n=1 Tax=Talaromyces thermophilus TaxID=28565 RepID=UPI00374237E8
MSDRRTTFAFNDNESELMPIPAGIPQGSPISPFLFLFYNSDLVDICNPREIRVHGLGFVDDVNLLAWGPTIQSNCAALERLHERCLDWARRHGAKFSPEKYELLHLTRNLRANTRAGVRLGEILKTPSSSVRVLGLHLDPRLQWTAHKKFLEDKMRTQEAALTRLAGSTWDSPCSRPDRCISTSLVRP